MQAVTRELTIVAQDPSVRRRGRILTAPVRLPVEQLGAGPRGYRVHVIDYDASSNRLYRPCAGRAMGTIAGPRENQPRPIGSIRTLPRDSSTVTIAPFLAPFRGRGLP